MLFGAGKDKDMRRGEKERIDERTVTAKAKIDTQEYAFTVARGLAPAGLRSSPKTVTTIYLKHLAYRIYDGFAAERGQAPSPQ